MAPHLYIPMYACTDWVIETTNHISDERFRKHLKTHYFNHTFVDTNCMSGQLCITGNIISIIIIIILWANSWTTNVRKCHICILRQWLWDAVNIAVASPSVGLFGWVWTLYTKASRHVARIFPAMKSSDVLLCLLSTNTQYTTQYTSCRRLKTLITSQKCTLKINISTYV